MSYAENHDHIGYRHAGRLACRSESTPPAPEGLRNPEPGPEPEAAPPEPEAQTKIKDPELLAAMANVAEKLGADKVKAAVKSHCPPGSYGSVKDVTQDMRPKLMQALKEAFGSEPDPEPAPEPAPATDTPRPRRG